MNPGQQIQMSYLESKTKNYLDVLASTLGEYVTTLENFNVLSALWRALKIVFWILLLLLRINCSLSLLLSWRAFSLPPVKILSGSQQVPTVHTGVVLFIFVLQGLCNVWLHGLLPFISFGKFLTTTSNYTFGSIFPLLLGLQLQHIKLFSSCSASLTLFPLFFCAFFLSFCLCASISYFLLTCLPVH